MIDLSHNHCCGCGACAVICPKTAIVMRESDFGFVYPVTDVSKCVDCGLCDKTCPELATPELSKPQAVYAVCGNDKRELSSCASGGAATILGKYIIRQGGVVYGCSQKDYRTIHHIRVVKDEQLERLKGSKYVQSDMGTIYIDVKKDLAAGLVVLFVGTPCQVGALRSFLKKPYDNLYTVDLVCHGVPSQAMLRNAVETTTKPDRDMSVNFRWKTQYGIQFGIQFGNNGSILKSVPAIQSAYMTAFLKGLSYRENCHNCKYARGERIGDITIGDFWGLGKETPSNLNPQHGVSLIMVNTARGTELWEQTKGAFEVEKRNFDEAAKHNWNLHDPSPRPATKDKFLEVYNQKGMEQAVRSCVRRYRIESMAVVRFIRCTPILNQIIRLGRRSF